ncbi:MAG: HAMP domain-containing sensor histidine kinase [Deltaproteobacteria bacterium]|nr:HAMP domain-containing sensor histidine kinase [Deltaproteobacteria bacterium]
MNQDSIVATRASWISRVILLPALVVAVGFLSWWTVRTTRDLRRLDKASIIESTLLLARERVDRIEQQVIAADNAVFQLVNPDDLDPLALRWIESAPRVSPAVRSVLVLDANERPVRHITRDSPASARAFLSKFSDEIRPLLHLSDTRPDAHNHLHHLVRGEEVFVSSLTREVAGRRHYVILQGDVTYLREHLLPSLFDDSVGQGRFSVVDQDGRTIVGRALGGGDFVVTLRFPSTVYRWRLSAEPNKAEEIAARSRSRPVFDVVLVALSLGVLVVGVVFLAFAARNEQRLNRLKSDFIATVSHELKTPLSLIRMFGEMLSSNRQLTEDRRKQYLQIIVRESERLTSLIENVLDFARVERGKASYEFSPGNLGELTLRSVDLFRSRLDRDRPVILVDVSKNIPDSELDEQALQLLILNLLDNALKYAPDGERIVVRVRHQGARLTLEVEDEGPGIDDEDSRRIFERFYRGRHAREHGARGSGIGLALVQHIARAHGGDVAVRSAKPHGALFTVAMPLHPVGKR